MKGLVGLNENNIGSENVRIVPANFSLETLNLIVHSAFKYEASRHGRFYCCWPSCQITINEGENSHSIKSSGRIRGIGCHCKQPKIGRFSFKILSQDVVIVHSMLS